MAIDIRKPLKTILPHLRKAKEEHLNEADTMRRISKLLEDVLGYDGFTEITREQQIKKKYVDIAVKIDGVIRFLVEVKSAGTELRDRHLEQAQHYAAEGNIRWVVLSNGVDWILYHLSFDEGIEYEQAFKIDLSVDPINKAAETLSVLHRQSIIRNGLESFWKKRSALNASSIGKVIFHEDTLRLIRRLIRKQDGIFVDEEDLGRAITSLFSPEAREQIGPFKIRRSSRRKIKKIADKSAVDPAAHPTESEASKKDHSPPQDGGER